MPARRKTRAELHLSGATTHEARKYGHRADPITRGPIGQPPAHLSEAQARVWEEITQSAPEGTLTTADAILIETAVRLTEKLRAGLLTRAAEISALSGICSKLGLSPADRSRLNITPPPAPSDEYDPWDELLRTPPLNEASIVAHPPLAKFPFTE